MVWSSPEKHHSNTSQGIANSCREFCQKKKKKREKKSRLGYREKSQKKKKK